MQRFSVAKYIKAHYTSVILALLIIGYLFNGIQYLRSQSITDDEGSFYDYAKRYAKGHPERVNPITDNSKMPVSVLNIMPRAIQQAIHPGLKKFDWGIGDIMMGRVVTLFISICIILLVYKWSNQLYGEKAALFAAFLMALCPNNLANAALVTTDSYSVLFLLAAMFFLWKFCTAGTNKYFLLFSLTVAFAQLVKQSLFHLYVLIPVCLTVYYLVNRKVVNIKSLLKYFAVFALISLVVINAGYYFRGSNTTLGNYHFMSLLFQSVQHMLPAWLPIPLPGPFVDGLDMAKYYDQLGGGHWGVSSFGKVTILGQSAIGGSFWYYYFVSIFYKTPVTYLVLLVWTVLLWVKKSAFVKWVSNEFFLIAPVLYFLIIMSFFYKTQCGIRHIIFIYPFLFIASSGIIPHIKNRYQSAAVAALSFFLVISVLRYWRNYYPYTNEFIYDKKMACNYVGTGNLDFQQGEFFYREYIAKHPGVKRFTGQPEAGVLIVTADEYLNIWSKPKYDWITHFKPSGQVAYSAVLINVTAKDLEYIK